MGRHSLFGAVVVSGAALTCQRRETGETHDLSGVAATQATPSSVRADASKPPAAQTRNPAAPLEPSAMPAPSATVATSNAAPARARALGPARIAVSATPKSRPCPPGSEMPFPPCYYIL